MSARMRRSCGVRREALVLHRWFAQTLEHPLGERGVEQRLPLRDAPHGVDDVGALQLLEQVAGRAGDDGLEHRLVVGERREHDALDLRVRRTDLTAHFDTVAVGKAHVEDGDVGPGRRDARERLLDGPGLAHHLDVVLGLEQVAHPDPDDLVVVEEEDADGLRSARLLSRHGREG